MPSEPRNLQRSRIPSSRGERLAKIGWLAGRMAFGAAAEGVRRLSGGVEGAGHVAFTEANARRLTQSLSSMRGAAMKLGQLLSLEADDLLPPEAASVLADLRDAAHAMPPDQLRGVLEGQWGSDWQRSFADFDFEPIAAASIGQVHTATTHAGRELALKIQYPGIARSIDSDVDNLATALRLARILPGDLDFDPLLDEVKRTLRDEADYEREADQLQRYASLLADEPEVVVPGVDRSLTTRSILAMDRLRGVPLEDLCSPEHADEERDRVAALLLRLVLREFFEFHFVQSDPNFANYMLLNDGRIGLIDLGAGQPASPELCRGYAALLRASLACDREAQRWAATQMGVLRDSDPESVAEAVLDIVTLVTEPFRHAGRYDFGASDIPARARQGSMGLLTEHQFLRPPPAEMLFLQRKLGGTFLLCSRLRADVDARELLECVLADVEQAGR